MTETDRISVLKSELAALKKQRKDQAIAAKAQNTWVNIKKGVPSTNRIFAWADGKLECCWYHNDSFYAYAGSFFCADKDRLDNVTHWMPKDWMVAQDWPQCGPGLKNRIVYLWRRFTQGASSMAHDLRPKGWSGNVQLSKKPSFFVNRSTGEIMTGGPEHVNAPSGYEKIVCTNAYQAEQWSERQRRWDKSKHGRIMEERGAIEEAKHAEIRAEIHRNMANARNAVNRDFLRAALEISDRKGSPWKYERESYLHAEGHEDRR